MSIPNSYIVGDEPSNIRHQTNPRYRGFNQIIYTAGDEEQFNQNIDKVNYDDTPGGDTVDYNLPSYVKEKIDLLSINDQRSVNRTFRYIFHELKKGIYVSIQNGKIETFLPFSKHNYFNRWGDLLDSKLSERVIKSSQIQSGRVYNKRKVNQDKRQWVANGPLVRFEYPPNEGDSNVTIMKDMLETLCSSRDVPNIRFFINRRDFPQLRKDGNCPSFPELFNNPIVNPEGMCPILSMCSSDNTLDIPFVTWDEWARISYLKERKCFTSVYAYRNPTVYSKIIHIPWVTKKDKVVFRGSSTGPQIDLMDNPRIIGALMSDERLDIGITSLNLRPRVRQENNKMELTTMDISQVTIPIKEYINTTTQSMYRYILSIPGHVCGFRLAQELSYGSVILLVECEHSMWFQSLLKEGVHYISIKPDLSNLIEKLDWCQQNEDLCGEIASNALEFFNTYLSEDAVLDFMQSTLYGIKEKIGNYQYNPKSALEILESLEKQNSKLINIIDDGEIVSQSKTTTIKKTGYCITKSVTDNKVKELYHESFIAQNALRDIPQFPKFYGIHENRSKWEYVEGKSLFEYLNQENFSIPTFLNITRQVFGLLQIAWEKSRFNHRDLMPWNIIITDKEDKCVYTTKRGEVVSNGKIIYITDFGKSYANIDGIHSGRIRPFEPMPGLDIIMYILSCCEVILKIRRHNKYLRVVFDFMNYITKTSYRPAVFQTVNEIREFIKKERKYTELLYSDKDGLEYREPIEFLKYLNMCERLSPTDIPVDEGLPEDVFEVLDDLYTLKDLSDTSKKTIRTISTIIKPTM